MTELEKMQRAKMYIDKLANGINPIDDNPVSENDAINNIRISRCLFYVSDILRQVIENDGTVGKAKKSKPSKTPFFISDESIKNFPFSNKPIPISEITKRLNELADLDVCYKLKNTALTSWLIEINALELKETSAGSHIKYPTDSGKTLGISVEKRIGMNGEYIVIVYNKDAQQFILDNLDAIIEHKNNTSGVKKAENQGQAWTTEQDDCLTELFNKNIPVAEIATDLKRTETGIRARLKRLGLIENRADAK